MSDEEWAFFERFILSVRAPNGRKPTNHRRVLDGVLPTFNARVMALRFLLVVTCGHEDFTRHLQYRRQPRKLPVVLSIEEVSELLTVAPGPGLKYRAALSISYGAGLRAAEVCSLKIGDIDSDRMLIHVEQGKGRKDRKEMLSPGLLNLLRDYWREARPEGWLFPGKPRINAISSRQLNRALFERGSRKGPRSIKTAGHGLEPCHPFHNPSQNQKVAGNYDRRNV
ncbi:Phage integrase family protein [Aliiruegeria lutimaris]|uniref:Phage integrase family protein n=1 Tax=Aliiruegeria lutimaris TaxID=571298 RepID=A0A1G9PWN8_9RHOB|nr:Phage integrase family protein [Aliiruegeria lutimaris]